MLTQLLIALILLPVFGFIINSLVPKRREGVVSFVAISTIFTELALLIALTWQWARSGAHQLSAQLPPLFSNADYTFALTFHLDLLSVIFFSVATLITCLIFIFSRYYLHREPGFKRFYGTVLLFFTGLAFIILAGNFETLLIGWELIGITSVLLIAFYRDRFLPARNALRVFSVYRIADAFLLAAIWYAHHIFETSINFSDFSSLAGQHGDQLAILGALLLVVALIKSAQYPFSYWLPRAMEGPTTSSAIFYGALSVHMGLFLLLRTYPLWAGSIWLHIIIGVIGAITAITASSIARSQSSIKSQIAYASITQIGIMFIEIALGLPWLAVIHFVCNALLRTYQLLISPSIVGYLTHDQFFYFVPPAQKIKNTLFGKLRATVYILSIKEWNMNTAATKYLWQPLKTLGRTIAVLDKRIVQILIVSIFFGMSAVAVTTQSASITQIMTVVAIVVAIACYVRAYTTKKSAKVGWNLIALGHLFSVLFLALASHGDWKYIVLYGSGLVLAFIAGRICLNYIEAKGESIALRTFNGVMSVHGRIGHAFFIICLVFMAFPISPSFLGQDILLSLIPQNNAVLLVLFCFSYLLIGVSVMRLYIKVFFGSHKTKRHEIAYKSS